MEKAGKVIRRSSVRLKAIGTGHSELSMVLCSLRDVKIASKNLIHAQSTASQDLLHWSIKTENRAIQDTFAHLTELCTIWEDIQREFTEHLKEVRNHFQLIYEGERHIDQVRGHLSSCEALENSIKKDLKKSTKKANPEDVRQLEIKLAQAQRAKDLAQLEVVDKVQEHEAVKLIRVKESLLKLSESYLDLANKCKIVYESHREIAQQLPDVQDKCIHDLRYTGSVAAKQAVIQAREKVRQYRGQSLQNSNPSRHDPPPPYSSSFCSDNTSYNLPNSPVYPDAMNPFYTSSPTDTDTRYQPVMYSHHSNINARSDISVDHSSSSFERDLYSSPLDLNTRRLPRNESNVSQQIHNNASSMPLDEEEIVGAIGGVRLS